MLCFRFGHGFGAVLIPFSSLALVTEAEERRNCVECVARHLAIGGTLLIDLPAVPPERRIAGPRRVIHSFRLPPRGHDVEKTVEETLDPTAKITHIWYRYEIRRARVESAPMQCDVGFALAAVERPEIEAFLYASGFDFEELLGDYRGSPFTERSPRLIVRAVRLA
jgi:hypothetical protein